LELHIGEDGKENSGVKEALSVNGGRLTLIKSLVSRLPTYFSFLFLFPLLLLWGLKRCKEIFYEVV
jgi:hypothetical protein